MLAATWFVLAGMGMVFAALGLLVLVMTVLTRWLVPKPAAGASTAGRSDSGGAGTTRARNA